jgi:predicted DNA-binding antitoxin AbrB/MazE fold protein
MALEIEAVYENGVLKLDYQLPLENGQRVRVTVQPVMGRARQSAGLMGWKGTHEELEEFLGPDNHPWASAE